jgi:hypothetical protein
VWLADGADGVDDVDGADARGLQGLDARFTAIARSMTVSSSMSVIGDKAERAGPSCFG